MVDLRRELHLRRLKWVVGGEVDVQEEDAVLVRRVLRPHDRRLPVEEVVAHGEVLVIGNGSPEFRGISDRLRDGQMVVDLVRAFGSKVSNGAYQGICW